MTSARQTALIALVISGGLFNTATAEETYTVKLQYSDDLSSWNVNYFRPSHWDLSPVVPGDQWVAPAPRGRQ